MEALHCTYPVTMINLSNLLGSWINGCWRIEPSLRASNLSVFLKLNCFDAIVIMIANKQDFFIVENKSMRLIKQ